MTWTHYGQKKKLCYHQRITLDVSRFLCFQGKIREKEQNKEKSREREKEREKELREREKVRRRSVSGHQLVPGSFSSWATCSLCSKTLQRKHGLQCLSE